MDIEAAEKKFGSRWGEWQADEQREFVRSLEPDDLKGSPLVITLCCAWPAEVPETIKEIHPELRTLKSQRDPCQQEGCENDAKWLVFWPGKETRQCSECLPKVEAVASAMDFRVSARELE